jgi:hypothetical protein
VFGFIAFFIASSMGEPWGGLTTSNSIKPFDFRKCNGRSTELCSKTVVITCPPFLSVPNIAVLSASVQFFVKTTRSGEAPKNSASSFLQLKTISAPETDSLCPLLPGFAERYLITVFAVSLTARGLNPPVAALSK